MPPDATGKDTRGNYTKVEDGLTVVWNSALHTWERPLNVNDEGIPLRALTEESHNVGLKDQVWLYVYVSDKVQGSEKAEFISHHPGANVDNLPGGHPINFSNQFFSDLTVRVYGNMLNHPLFQDVMNGRASVEFTTSEGPQTWKLGPDTKVIVDILDQPARNGFRKW